MNDKQSSLDIRQANLYRKLIELGPAVAFIWSPEAGWPVHFVSENIAQLGYKAEDFLSGKIKYNEIIHKQDRERVASEVEANIKSGSTKFEQRYRILNASGEVRLIRDWTRFDRDENGNVQSIEGIIVDITDLVAADERARRYLNSTNDIYVSVDNNGILLDANDKAARLVGVSREELIGCNWVETYVAFEYRASIVNALRKATQQMVGSEGTGEIQEAENEIVSKSGERHRIHWYYSLILDSEGALKYVDSFGADVSEVREIQKEADALADSLMENPNPVIRLSSEGDVLFANTSAQELLMEIARLDTSQRKSWLLLIDFVASSSGDCSRELQVGDRSYLFMINPNNSEKYYNLYGLDVTGQKDLTSRLQSISENLPGALFEYSIAANGKDSINYMSPGCEEIWELSAEEIKGDPAPIWEMILPEDFDAMRKSVLDSGENLTQWAHDWRVRPRSGKVKWLRGSGTPVRRADGTISWITIIIDITETKEAEAAVSEALRKTIYVLSAALEARDPYTAGHEQRVTRIAVQIGKKMKLDPDRLTGLELAATVHDVGKIKIPAEILSKPGRLTPAELELIKTHAAAGAELLKDINFDWPISTIILQHHERADGSGYPNGLKGDEILLEAKIIAVADTLEAMASHRPYRPGLGIEKAADEIRQGAGTRYDAEVAAVCLKLLDEGEISLEEDRETSY